MSVPATRLLAHVLRGELAEDTNVVRLVAGVAGNPTGTPGYANVTIAGKAYRIPRLASVPEPAAGVVAYVLATDRLMLYIGTVVAS